MKLNKLYIVILAGLSMIATSCSDFLDTNPDTRVTINTPEQVAKLLTTGYFWGNYGVICELSSDNVIDNNAPHIDTGGSKEVRYDLPGYSRMYDELFAFKPVKSASNQDSPTMVWEGCYGAISVANHALERIESIRKAGNGNELLDGCEGEALLIRAYTHFVLVNVFSPAYRTPELSRADIGVPYVTTVEENVLVNYKRDDVTTVYEKIRTDLEAGLALIDDATYQDGAASKYHFNEKAAHAFAARFYLFIREYDKAIEHANMVLGETEESTKSCMPDWHPFEKCVTGNDYANVWNDASSPNNLMLVATFSTVTRGMSGGTRYACNGDAAAATLFAFTPTCDIKPNPTLMNSGLFVNGKQDYGLWSSKCMEMFEYTDKVAGIGFPHVIRREFTATETLLCRAEAKLLKANPDIDGAFSDLRIYDNNRQDLPTPGVEQYFKPLTKEIIEKWYTKEKHPLAVLDYNTDKMAPGWVIKPEVAPYFHCVMDYRRNETIGDGNRFFDLKRFGIEYGHKIGKGKEYDEEFLTWNDPRRAIEVPQEVLAAGMQSSQALVSKAGAPKDHKFEVKNSILSR